MAADLLREFAAQCSLARPPRSTPRGALRVSGSVVPSTVPAEAAPRRRPIVQQPPPRRHPSRVMDDGSKRALRVRVSGLHVVVDVRFLSVVRHLLLEVEVVRVLQLGVVVLVRVPEGAVLPLVNRTSHVVVGDVVVIVLVHRGRVSVSPLTPLAFGPLRRLG